MKNLLSSLFFILIINLLSSCLYDKADNAMPDNGCDTTYYTLTIKPIIDNNCAVSGCHATGGTGTGNYTTYVGMEPYLANGSISLRINLDASDPLHMPLGNLLDSLSLVTLNQWIASGYIGCD